MDWKLSQHGIVTTVDMTGVGDGWAFWILLRSDAHRDSIYSNRDLEKLHLDMALERNAGIIDAGDMYDIMQSRKDPRSSYDELRPEFKVANYFTAVVRDNAEFYKPYAHNFIVMGKGNHETSILRHNNLDLTSELVYDLNKSTGSNIQVGGYGGYVRFILRGGRSHQYSVILRYFHGNSTSAPVTRGTIETNRQAVYLPDANVVLNGHNHHAYYVPIARQRINNFGRLEHDIIHFVRTPGYKRFTDENYPNQGFDAEKLPDPKPIGCVWMQMTYSSRTGITLSFTPDFR